MFREGSKVTYVGWHGRDGLAVGDTGKVLSTAEKASHILITSGSANGNIMFLYNDDLVATANSSVMEIDDSISEGGFSAIAVRKTYDDYGADALLNALYSEGHLNRFEEIADQTLQFVAGQVRNDPGIRIALAELDDDEASEFVSHVSAVLLRDAFDEVE